MVQILELRQPSIINILSLVVPTGTSRTIHQSLDLLLPDSAYPNLSFDNSSKRGTIFAPVAIAIASISIPPTHLTA